MRDAIALFGLLDSVNVRAFLHTIRVGEGTADPDGFRRMFGGELFDSYADHPRKFITKNLGGKPITSSAAGAPQFLVRTWDEVASALSLRDFSPKNQEIGALFLIERRKALDDVIAGRFEIAVRKCNREWASLPESPYGQPTRTMAQALQTYTAAGGSLTAEPLVHLGPEPIQTTPKEQPMLPFIAAALPYLIQAAPDLIRAFGDSPRSEKNAKAAEAVADIAMKVTGQDTVQGAVQVIQNDPEKAAAYREQVHLSMGELLSLVERVNAMDQKAIAAARDYNTTQAPVIDAPWLKLRFIEILSLIFVVYCGWFVSKFWLDLTPELRGAVITLMIIAGWNGVRDYWMGSSSGSDRKTQMLTEQSK